MTGNTGIDAVPHVRNTLDSGALPATEWPQLNPQRRLIVVTSHRRENLGPGFASAMGTLARIADRPDVEIVYPVHVLRHKTERPEAVEAGTVKLVGTDEERIVSEAVRPLEDRDEYIRMTRVHNPCGDGRARGRIAEAISSFLQPICVSNRLKKLLRTISFQDVLATPVAN